MMPVFTLYIVYLFMLSRFHISCSEISMTKIIDIFFHISYNVSFSLRKEQKERVIKPTCFKYYDICRILRSMNY